jgi:hypothetical protein
VHEAGLISINERVGVSELIVQNGGVYELDGGDEPTYLGAASDILIESGGVLRITQNSAGLSGAMAGSASMGRIFYEDGGIFEWNNNLSFLSSDQTYFPDAPIDIAPIFRVSLSPGIVGAGSPNNTTINGIFEANANVTWQNTATKEFRNGIRGSGNITQASNCGPFIFSGEQAYLEGSGTITLNQNGLTTSSTGVNVILESSKTINDNGTDLSSFTIANGDSLSLSEFVLSGTTDLVFEPNSTCLTQNPGGLDAALAMNLVDWNFPRNQTIVYRQNGAQNSGSGTDFPGEFGNLEVKDGSQMLLQKPIQLNNDLLIEAASFLDAGVPTNDISIRGDYTNNGIYLPSGNRVVFNGSVVQERSRLN